MHHSCVPVLFKACYLKFVAQSQRRAVLANDKICLQIMNVLFLNVHYKIVKYVFDYI